MGHVFGQTRGQAGCADRRAVVLCPALQARPPGPPTFVEGVEEVAAACTCLTLSTFVEGLEQEVAAASTYLISSYLPTFVEDLEQEVAAACLRPFCRGGKGAGHSPKVEGGREGPPPRGCGKRAGRVEGDGTSTQESTDTHSHACTHPAIQPYTYKAGTQAGKPSFPSFPHTHLQQLHVTAQLARTVCLLPQPRVARLEPVHLREHDTNYH